MDLKKIVLLITIFMVNTYSIFGQNESISCEYVLSTTQGYICYLKITNPYGFNNFTAINGTHLAGMTDNDVKIISSSNPQSNTSNVPSIFCEKFKNTEKIILYLNKIQKLDDYSFKNCKQLLSLELIGNLITEIDEDAFEENTKLDKLYIGLNPIKDLPENLFEPLKNLTTLSISRCEIATLRSEWFEPLVSLQSLHIYENPIEVFPKKIFEPLKNLRGLYAQKCNLKKISSDSFGIHPQLATFAFTLNEIEAIDERIIDNTNATYFYMSSNICADINITDTSASRQSMRTALRNCFDNYEELFPETTTTVSTTTQPTTISSTTTEVPTTTEYPTTTQTLPPGCNVGNLDERLCKIEDVIEGFHDNFKDIKDGKEEMQEALENQNALIAEILEENQQQKLLIEGLQSELKAKSDNFGATLEDLQEQVLILSTRPCSCY